MTQGTSNNPQQPNQQELQNLLRQAAQQLGTDPNMIQNSAQNGNMNDMLKNLRPQDAQNLQNVLADKEATAKILNSPQAQMLLKKLFERK